MAKADHRAVTPRTERFATVAADSIAPGVPGLFLLKTTLLTVVECNIKFHFINV